MKLSQSFNQNQFLPQNSSPPQQSSLPTSRPNLQDESTAQQQGVTKKEVSVPQAENSSASSLQASSAFYLYIFYAVILGVFIFFLKRLFDLWRRSKKHQLPAEDDGTLCLKCGGSGKIIEEYEESISCVHCKGSGQDPCHHCSGTGKMSLPNPPSSKEELESWPPCDFCRGSGKAWKSKAMPAGIGCCMCHGKKKEIIKKTRTITCPICKGSGRKK